MAYSKFSEMVEKCKENPHTKTVAVAGAAVNTYCVRL